MAKQFPRDVDLALKKIESMCGRVGIAKTAEYEYTRGGTKISGASIRLIESIAQAYGNLTWSWKELKRENGVSSVLAYAWDLETNTRVELGFEVILKRDTKNGSVELTAERDIYELIASQAQRRVRKCLEGIIPRDIIESAREWCDKTLETKVDVQAGIDKAITFFHDTYNVSLKQIEEKFGMNRRAFTSKTYLALQKLYTSVKDGMVSINEVFPPLSTAGENPISALANPKVEEKTLEKENPTTTKEPKKADSKSKLEELGVVEEDVEPSRQQKFNLDLDL